MKLRMIEPPASDVRETIESALAQVDELDGVLIIGLKKDSTQLLISSTMNQLEKSFLLAFHQAVSARWFDSVLDMTPV